MSERVKMASVERSRVVLELGAGRNSKEVYSELGGVQGVCLYCWMRGGKGSLALTTGVEFFSSCTQKICLYPQRLLQKR